MSLRYDSLMRVARRLAVGGVALFTSACSLWYVLADPYGGIPDGAAVADGGGADAANAGDATDASDGCAVCNIASNVNAIATFGDALYANVGGSLWVCADAMCSSLVPLIELADASPGGHPSIAANGMGVAWTEGAHGVYYANVGKDAGKQVATDVLEPGPIVLDSAARLSYVGYDVDAGTLVRSCPNVELSACTFSSWVATDAGVGTGGGVTIVTPAQAPDTTSLAATAGEVAWTSGDTIYVTNPASGAVTQQLTASQCGGSSGLTTPVVASDGQSVFCAAIDKSGSPIKIDTIALGEPYSITKVGGAVNAPYCFSVNQTSGDAGLVAACQKSNTVTYFMRKNQTGTPVAVPVGGSDAIAFTAATTSSLFILTIQGALFRAPLD